MRIHTLQSVWSASDGVLARHLSEGGRLDHAGELSDLAGGGSPPALADGAESCFFCGDEWLNDRLVKLHRLARLGYGRNIQGHIDSHLPAVAFLSVNVKVVCDSELVKRAAFARRMVLSISDAPQEGTLPDLGCVLRSVLLGYSPSGQRGGSKAALHGHGACDFPYSIAWDCYVTQMLLGALPCIRRAPNKNEGKGLQGHQIGLNVLLGFLLGLCPSAVKFPPFQVRVAIYSAIHQLLTGGGGKAFCEAHPMLMTMAFMEYCSHVIPAYMPAEHEVMQGEQGMQGFFSSIPVASDVFRQEMLNNLGYGIPIPWERLEQHCDAVVDKHTRACKNRAKQRREDHGLSSRIPLDVVESFSALPYVTPYNVHLDDATHRILGSELAVLDLNRQPSAVCGAGSEAASLGGPKERRGRHYETVAAMQRLLCVSSLPGNIVRMQLRSLGACMSLCERSALDGMMLYICASCGLCSGGSARNAQTRGQCRLDGGLFVDEWGCAGSASQSGLVCSHCQTPSVMAVNSLGRVVSLRNQRFFLAPCCCTVQVYRGAGVEFQTEYCQGRGGDANAVSPGLSRDLAFHSCPHQKKKAQQRPQRAKCEVCQTASAGAVAPEVFTAVDHLTGRMHSIRLCSRHAPRVEALRHVANWRQLIEEVGKRDRPLFAASSRK